MLNLTAFETLFEERRPFFVEGSQIFEFEAGPGQLLYARRGVEDELEPLGPWPRSPFARSVGSQIADAFDVFPDNLFLVKFSYTFLN